MARKEVASRRFRTGILVNARLAIMRKNIDRLRNFHDEGETHFKTEFNKLEVEVDRLTREDWDEFGDFFIEQRYDLEELRELKRNFSIVGLFTVLEIFLRRTLLHLRKAGAAVEGCIRKMSLEDMRDVFKKIGVPIAKDNSDWQAIMGMKLVRNCVTHYDCHPHKKMAKQLKEDYKISVIEERWKWTNGEKSEPVSWRIQLTGEYFGKSADLVERVCKWAARGYFKYAVKKNLSRP